MSGHKDKNQQTLRKALFIPISHILSIFFSLFSTVAANRITACVPYTWLPIPLPFHKMIIRYTDDSDSRIAHPVRFVPMFMIPVFNHIFFSVFWKIPCKNHRHTTNFRNFNLSEHSGTCLNVVFVIINLMLLSLYCQFTV